MAIGTCIDMVNAALLTAGINGVGQTALAEDVNTGFDLLIEVVETWKRERFMAWRNVEVIIPSTGAQSYAMFDRPPRLDSAYARLLAGQPVAPPPLIAMDDLAVAQLTARSARVSIAPKPARPRSVPEPRSTGPVSLNNAGPIDFPLAIIDSQSDYNDISLKQLTTFPAAVWYSPDYPTGSLWFWPIPPAGQFDLHVFYRAGLPTYTALTDPLGLPPEYIRALRYELATLLLLNYGRDVNPGLVAALVGTQATIRATNAHLRNMQMPSALVPGMPGQGGISGAVGPHQSVIILDSGLPVLG